MSSSIANAQLENMRDVFNVYALTAKKFRFMKQNGRTCIVQIVWRILHEKNSVLNGMIFCSHMGNSSKS